MKANVFAICLLTVVSGMGWTFDLRSMCSTSMPTLEGIRHILGVLGPLAGEDRKQCGLPGEDFKVCLSCTDLISKEQMQAIRPMLASESHRDWHFNWHWIRWKWAAPETTDSQRRKWIAEGWVKDQDSMKAHQLETVQDNVSGEDFFFMHREMIKMVQAKLVMSNLPCISGWQTLPDQVDESVYRVRDTGPKAQKKLLMLKDVERELRDPARLRQLSLAEFGRIVEKRLHGDLHQLWDNGDPCADQADKNQERCDGLLESRSGQVNPHFWKLHGLIDNMLEDWLKAHDKNEIAVDCEGRPKCYQWKGTWLGKRPPSEIK